MIVGGTPLLLGGSSRTKTLFIGGQFTSVESTTRNRLAAVTYNKKLAAPTLLSWDPNCNNRVLCLAQDADKLIIGGEFTQINSTSRNYLASIDIANIASVSLDSES